METYVPSYVQFLREHYGFSDEDPEERRRIAEIEAGNARSVNASLCLENGECVTVSLEGQAPYHSFINDVERHHKSRVLSIDFSDSIDSENSLNSSCQKESTVSSPINADIFSQFASSSWDQVPALEKGFGDYGTNPLLVTLDKNSVLKRYSNFALMTMMERSLAEGVRVEMRNTYRPPTDKEKALLRITELEDVLALCERDIQTGRRDMDTLNDEIRCIKDEIKALRRKHVNYFYFF